MKKLALASALSLLVCMLLTGGTIAATLNVPGDYSTVQSAIDAAVAGDIIQVAAGTYQESLGGWRDIEIFKSISLIGAGSDQTIIELSGLQHGVEIRPDVTGIVLVEGIAFTRRTGNTYSSQWGIIVGETGGTFNSVIFRDVEVAYSEARDIHFANATYTYALLEDCNFHHAGSWGCSVRGVLTDFNIVDSDFEYNGTVDAAHGIGFDLDSPTTVTSLTVTGGSFSNNTAKGINLVKTNNATFTGITASSNAGGPGAGFGISLWEWAASSSNLTFDECTIENNGLDGFLFGTEGTCTIDGITIEDCLVTGNSRAGIFFYHDLGGTATGIAINGCYLAGNGSLGGLARSALTSPIDGSANWWGVLTPGDVAATAGSNIDYTPWLASGTDLSAAPGFQADWSILWVDDDSQQSGTVGRVQEGIDLVSGSTVNLAPGTYEEQLDIGKDLILQGSGPGTEILSPDLLTLSWATSRDYRAIIYVHDADVEIRDITLNGAGKGNANVGFLGVGFRNAGGGIYDCDILDIRNTPFSGAQYGVGVSSWNDDLTARSIDIHGCTFLGFQKNAMALNADATTGLEVDVRGNTITGYGATDITAQNGVQVYGDLATGTVADNVISGIAYDNTAATTKWVATSILQYFSDIDITGNTITGSHMAIYNIDGSGTIQGNDVTIEKVGVYAFGIIGSDPPKAVPSPTGLDDMPAGSSRPFDGAPLAQLDVDILDNVVTFTGPDNTATFGIEVDAGWGPDDLDATIMYNTVCGFEVGIEIYACQSDCDTGVFTSVVATNNYLGCGNTMGMRSNAAYIVTDGTNNWWGDASGPYHATLNPTGTGEEVSDYIDFDPWLGAPNVLSVVPPYGTTTCTDPITYTFWFDHVGVDEVRGVNVTFQVDGTVATVANIVEGSYLPGFGGVDGTTFFVLDNGGGEYQVSTSILGGTTGATGSGDLFTVVLTPVAEGLSAITITDLKVRDVDNVPLDAAMVGGEVRIDCTGPTMEPIAEAEGVCYNAAPTFANFGFDDDQALDWAEYQIDAGGWVTLFSGIDAAEWNSDGWALPGFAGLSEGTHTVYFRVADMAGNENGEGTPDTYSWSFIKDTVPPAAPTGFTAMPGHNKVHLAWTNPVGDASFAGVEIRLVAWGDYPEYLSAPSYPADHLGGTYVTQETGESFDDAPRTPRDIYYYAVFAYDCAGNYSAFDAGAADRSTSYWLGDIANGPAWDGNVNLTDLVDFSITFGVSEGSGGWNPQADFGPTDDWSRFGIPMPDDVVDFEDLMIFSMNYGNVDPLGFDFAPEEKSPENLESMVAFELVPITTEAGTFFSVVMNSRASTLKGARLLIETGEGCEIVTVTKGDAIEKRGDVFFGKIPSYDGMEICVAALGVDRPLAGSGEIAKILVKSEGSISVSLVEAEIRDIENRQFVLEGTGIYNGPEIPIADALNQNFPNPFNPSTTVAFDLARPATVKIGIYDVSGRLVRTLIDRSMEAGSHEVGWNGTSNAGIGVPSGMYFYRMTTSDGFTATRKMILLR